MSQLLLSGTVVAAFLGGVVALLAPRYISPNASSARPLTANTTPAPTATA